MSYAVKLSSAELLDLYSDVRLGAAMGMIEKTDPAVLDRILMETMPATLAASGDASIATNSTLRDKARAALVRKELGIGK